MLPTRKKTTLPRAAQESEPGLTPGWDRLPTALLAHVQIVLATLAFRRGPIPAASAPLLSSIAAVARWE